MKRRPMRFAAYSPRNAGFRFSIARAGPGSPGWLQAVVQRREYARWAGASVAGERLHRGHEGARTDLL